MGLEFDSPKKAQLKLGFGDENKIILQLEQKVVSAIGVKFQIDFDAD